MDERNCIICTKKFFPDHYGKERGWWICSQECTDKDYEQREMNKQNLEKYSDEQCGNDAYDYMNFETKQISKEIQEILDLREQINYLKDKNFKQKQKIEFLTNLFESAKRRLNEITGKLTYKPSPIIEAGKCFFNINCFDRVDDDYYYCDVCRKKKEWKSEQH